ncbi:uncharacterized protein SAPINGB_P003242 [Magnusiomyces paraingens]|uniref:Nascent polypeptide-associated complex subunit beta n=1 Tax=Magnusiomyces paraingens TaxID=2606893 RepID=A0A5E8BT25_9ASCO|nr:uncharacterized protein SAPINGB_P003242 [Saprochaete ingens]VVT51875.1 unnamed protein product [Saprochaete ingens]
MVLDAEKLAKLQQSVRIGGKGTPRRKVKKTTKSTEADEAKIQGALKKLNAQTIQGIDQVNFFNDDGTVLHFPRPNVQAATSSNTFAIHGRPQQKQLEELMPGIITQLGAENIDKLRELASQLGSGLKQGAEGLEASGEPEDEGIPELVSGENFDKVD